MSTVRKGFSIPEELSKAVDNAAKNDDRSWSKMIQIFIKEGLDARGVKIESAEEVKVDKKPVVSKSKKRKRVRRKA